MDKLEFQNKIKEIGACENDATRRELLTQLQEACEPDYDRITNLETENNTLKNDNETLRSANMKLFLRVGEHKSQDEIDKLKGKDTPPEKREFKNLFDEKGNIK